MKVIFLDHDGVICLSNQWGNRYKKQKKHIDSNLSESEMSVDYRFDDFDQKALKVLNKIIQKTDCEIVVSSDWKKWATLEEMGDYYQRQGIIKRPIGYTTSILKGDLKFFDYNTNLEETRSYEIQDYLKNHPEITNWVAIDDLNMSKRINETTKEYMWGLENFVWTYLADEGIKQTGVKDKVIKYLVN
jgi:HAD domain in Swiss Army Knife RNA repair proteins